MNLTNVQKISDTVTTRIIFMKDVLMICMMLLMKGVSKISHSYLWRTSLWYVWCCTFRYSHKV